MTTDISKLKIVEGSKFFTERNGKIYFRETEEHAFMLHINEFHKSYKQLISAVGAGDWYKRFYESDIQDEVASAVSNKLCMDQIELWKGLADE